ncbi:hypothetical protein BJ508DRAFT_416511 [Ascobolus immersus RN42]|uniref:Uncharacterized protein n=1 Tax=Ascobolus immersus RN42 TaxID=1160509 RepID=A0A3N4I1H3_ASCIM|nr:hypothetical protein BJ508DRAFT_416511 [Ascobolus immersus RN42]
MSPYLNVLTTNHKATQNSNATSAPNDQTQREVALRTRINTYEGLFCEYESGCTDDEQGDRDASQAQQNH